MKINKKLFSKILLSILLACFVSGGMLAPRKAQALAVEDFTQIGQNVIGWVREAGLWAASKAWDIEIAIKEKVSVVTWHSVLNTALNKMAFETATWLGNGGKGQKPMFLTEQKGEYLKNMADNAAGQYIEAISKDAFGDTFNLCEPDISVKVLIGLGLVQPKLDSGNCTFTKMKDNWEKEILENKEFLSNFNNYFEQGGDLGASLAINEKVIKQSEIAKENATLDLLIDKGFLRVREKISGKMIDPPGNVEERLKDTSKSITDRLLISSGDALVDASKVFANQYFLTLFQRKMSELGSSKPKTSSPYDPTGVINTLKGLVDSEDSTSATDGSTVSQNLIELLQPNFQVSADFEVLTNLTTCTDPTSASPSECVIDNNFSSAVTESLTVGQAMKKGYLRENGKFGFIIEYSNNEYRCYDKEPSYTEGYPYRSLLILRKYRILPVGWELAAQYIHDYPQNTHSCTLGDMVACFDASDDYTYASESCKQDNWCRGLVDPDWVLTTPQHLCKSSGPGPYISYYQNARGATDLDSNLVVKRNEYCADEQSCIYEKTDGNCEVYGYCVEEKRKWKFGTDSCDPNFNSCETYRDTSGKSVSYLENTIDNSVCTSENVGCTDYCEDYNVAGNFSCTGATGDKVFLDKDVQACDKDNEGCHQYIRTKANLGTNLVQNSGFEENTVGQNVNLAPLSSGSIVAGDWMVRNNNTANSISATIFGVTSNRVHGGEKSLMVQANGPAQSGIYSFDYSQPSGSQLPNGYNMELNKTYSLSAWVYVESGGVDLAIGNNSTRWEIASSTQTGTWERLTLSIINDAGLSANEFYIYSNEPNSVFYVDDIQLEEGLYGTTYKDYGQANTVYEKILPGYLAASCYRNPGVDYRYRDDYDSACDSFARLCNADEVGCDLYTSVNTDISVPAKVDVMDYCTAECVGYDQYMQHSTYFSSQLPKYFIPATAEECDAGSVGCEEFTNLDAVAAGGETREYYSYLRQCVKPGEAGSNCGEFYTWEGSSETGFQLRVHSLQVDNDSDDASYPNPEAMYSQDPAVTEYDYDTCNELIYRLNLNADCREFYNRNGELSYHLYTNTITCSADCHDFRLAKNNVVKDPATGANISWPECQALSNFSDYHDIITSAEFTVRGECVFCKNGGTWDSGSDSCLYKAIPAEGVQCSAEVNGCREYSGNTGSSIYYVSVSTFEGSTQDWEGIGATTVITDNDSLRVNEEALRVQVAPYIIAQTVGTQVQRDKSYYLEFIAKSITASQFSAIYLTNGTEIANFATDPSLSMTLGGQYALYKLNLSSLNHAIADAESLVIRANGGFLIDDIKLVEITDRYYLIEDAWQTPENCFRDIYNNPVGPLYNLGCDEYTDRVGDTFYIHNFPTMCQESAVGCEAMIDTHNYSDYHGITLHAGDASEEVIPADNIVYAVYDASKSCFEVDKGCQILGKPYNYGNATVYRPLYLVNDPDDYTNILCYNDEKNCKAWTSREGNVYFKDPGNQTCEYRLESDSGGKKTRDWGWFKTSIKRCDADANGAVTDSDSICLESSDCSSTGVTCTADKDCGTNNVCISGICRNTCIDDKNDYPCPTINNATIGSGGEGGRINTPTVDGSFNNWVGICPSSTASCTEYLDPVSNFSVNLLANSNFASTAWVTYSPNWYCHNNNTVTCVSDANCTTGAADYCMNAVWRGSGTVYTQNVKLDRNYLYRIALINNDAGASLAISCPSLTEYDPANNEFGSVVTSLVVNNLVTNDTNSRFFYIPDGVGVMNCTVQATGINLGASDYAELKKIVIDYQLEAGLDKTSCNGIVNRNEGCVLFNERKVTSRNLTNIVYSGLNYDADNTVFGASPLACSGPNCNANQIIKVTPDRACNKWLACTGTSEAGKSGESVCDGIGICDKLDKNGNCERFVASIQSSYVYNPAISGIYTAGDIYNMSGYVKVGYLGTMVNRDTTRKSDDKFNFGSMRPYGGQTEITNNSFESGEENRCTIDPPSEAACGNKDFPADYEANIKASADWGDLDYPIYWICDPVGSSKCELIDDSIENEKENVCFLSDRDSTCKLYAPDGRAYLKLVANNEGAATMISDDFSAKGNTDYVMSFYVNTLRLSNGRARVRVFEYNESGDELNIIQRLIDYRKDWRKEVLRFTTNPATVSLRLDLGFSDSPQGNVFFDKIDILEALQVRNGISEVDTYETKDCRLYPKDDALSCDYYEGGIRYKGWTGYCLEYDRYPGWSNACLQWWSIPSSVDSVNAWCGDNRVGDEEDCDCAPDAAGEVYSCPSQNNPSGISVENQYYCENCMWTQGWCGDNYVDRTVHNEQCDWNDSENVDPVGSAPNTGVLSYNGSNYKISCENLPYAAVAIGGNLSGYAGRMYTDGNLGCFSSAAGKNYTATPLSGDKCRLDTSYFNGSYIDSDPTSDPVVTPGLTGFGCTNLLTGSAHNAEQCLAAGGQVVSDVVPQPAYPGGGVVIDSSGATVVGYSDFNNTFCKFTVGIGNDEIACQAVGGVPAVLVGDDNIFCRESPGDPIIQATDAICADVDNSVVPPVAKNPDYEVVTGLVCEVSGTYVEIPLLDEVSTVSNLCGNFGDGTWEPYISDGKPWTLTAPCTVSVNCNGYCASDLTVTSLSHNVFQNLEVETALAHRENCKMRWNGGCRSSQRRCYARVNEVGCY